MRLFLHVGLHKTGTTAVQKFLASNAATLAEQGVLYPSAGREKSAHHLIGRDLWLHSGQEGTLLPLVEELRDSSLGNAIVSSEHLEYLSSDAQFECLRNHLEPFDVRIVVYLRRQDHFLASSYAQDVKVNGFTCDIETYYRDTLERYDYGEILARWAAVFGPENLIVRPYEAARLPRGVIPDFLDAVGIGWNENFLAVEARPNTSLDEYGVRTMRVANTIIQDEDERLAFRRALKAKGQKAPMAGWGLLSSDLRAELLQKYADSNARVARKYLGRQDGRLFAEPESGCEAESGPIDTESDDHLAQLVKEWRQSHRKTNLETSP